MHKTLLRRGTSATRLSLVSVILVATLAGCATKPLPTSVDCPQPQPIPAALTESDSPKAQAFSKKVQAYLQKVQAWLKEQP